MTAHRRHTEFSPRSWGQGDACGALRRSLLTMARRAALLITLVLAGSAVWAQADVRNQPTFGQAKVIDGDTLDWSGRRWRIAAIDTPERGEPYYATAANRLRALTARGVRCTANGQRAQGRAVGSCYGASGEDVAAVLVREGLAAVCHQRQEAPAYAAAERQAQAERLGIWADGRYRRKPYCPAPRA